MVDSYIIPILVGLAVLAVAFVAFGNGNESQKVMTVSSDGEYCKVSGSSYDYYTYGWWKRTHTVAVMPPPPYADSSIALDSVEMAIKSWEDINPELDFEIVDGEADVRIEWESSLGSDRIGEYKPPSGFGCECTGNNYECVLPTSTIRVELGNTDCRGRYSLYSEDTLTDTVAHEMGHYNGLNHTDNPDHLMFGDSDPDYPAVPHDMFETLGLSIPAQIAGATYFLDQEGIQHEMDRLDTKLDDLNSEYDKLLAKYEVYPDVISDDRKYAEAMQIYADIEDLGGRINVLGDKYNRYVDEYNCFSEHR